MVYSTEQRNILLTFLKEHSDTVFSVNQIEEALSSQNISRSALYRNLAELEKLKKVKRSNKVGSREAFFQYYDNLECLNHIHLSCNKCGRIFHMTNDLAENLIENLKSQVGFTINKRETTLYGTCKECSKNKENQ